MRPGAPVSRTRSDAERVADAARKRRARRARAIAHGHHATPPPPRDPLLARHAEALAALRANPEFTIGDRLNALGMVVWGRAYEPYES